MAKFNVNTTPVYGKKGLTLDAKNTLPGLSFIQPNFIGFLFVIPVFVVFLLFQRFFVEGIATSGLRDNELMFTLHRCAAI